MQKAKYIIPPVILFIILLSIGILSSSVACICFLSILGPFVAVILSLIFSICFFNKCKKDFLSGNAKYLRRSIVRIILAVFAYSMIWYILSAYNNDLTRIFML
jgi:hypothetical protein